ncbi:MAG: L,D-transpeptidase family protein [Gammaproteobacteria bacterium]
MRTTILNLFILASLPGLSFAGNYEFKIGDSVVGGVDRTQARYEQTLPDIARTHKLGFREIKRANPEVDTWIPGDGQEVILPKQHVLPVVPHVGIVVNIPEMRLYYFPKPTDGSTQHVITYPIGIGREGWSTPYMTTTIIQKTEKPAWHPPESIREAHLAEGRPPLPSIVPPGPDNPLGEYAMRLGNPLYLIHGTNRPYGVGLRVSSGCIRLYPEDIESLFQMTGVGTPVRIVNQPYKVGVLDGNIYLEANPYLEEDSESFNGNLTSVVKMLVGLSGDKQYDVDWDLAKQVIDDQSGEPILIGRMLDAVMDEYTGNYQDTAVSRNHILDLRLETGIPSR